MTALDTIVGPAEHRRAIPPTRALQEFLEHKIDWQTDVARAIRVALEEDTELLGMLILLRIAMANTAALAHQSTADQSRESRSLALLRTRRTSLK